MLETNERPCNSGAGVSGSGGLAELGAKLSASCRQAVRRLKHEKGHDRSGG